MAASRSLETYRDKRDFAATSEPDGATGRKRRAVKHPRFVVQEHSATAMHWDLRLEHEGVLLSWAVPKGIPEAPGTQRLAIRTEDHPIEYLDFEGDIPEGSYGAGTMSIWDHGTYEPEELAVEDGKVHVRLEGERTHGRYVLVRTKGDAAEGTKEQWLLRRLSPAEDPKRMELPEHVKPMLAKLAELPAKAEEWAYEIKWDGIRALVFAEGGRIRIETRNLNDITNQYPELAALGRALGSRDAVIDGEIVAYDDAGRPSFQTLQSRLGLSAAATIKTRAAATPVRYLAFDLLHLEGRDLRELPYEDRRTLLRELLDDTDHWQVPAYHVGEGAGEDLLAAVVEQGLEGIVAKKLGTPYKEGSRGGTWLKIKQQQRQEFVVCGWTEGAGRRAGGIGAVLLGVYDRDRAAAKAAGEPQRLLHVGSVGTGFGDAALEALHEQFTKLAVDESPYDAGSPGATKTLGKWASMRAKDAAKGGAPVAIHYVKPTLVCEAEFTEFTRDGTLRHPSFKGLREDKDARDVVREDRA